MANSRVGLGRLAVAGVVLGALVAGAWGQDKDPDPRPAAVPAPENLADVEALVQAHNLERATEELPPLKSNPKLTASALAHARDMAAHNKMTHEGSDGSTPAQRVNVQGYHFRATGENVAAGQRNVPEVMRTWMDSPPHKKNILGDYTEMGAAMVKSDDGTRYWAVNFGLPMPVLDPERAAAEVTAGFNRERKKAGKPPLKVSARLAAAAGRHARAMAAKDEVGPKDDGGLTPFDRAQKLGYRYRSLGESNASGIPTAEEAVKGWLDDPKTRSNIIGDFRDIGVGYASSEKGTPYWCLLFGIPLR